MGDTDGLGLEGLDLKDLGLEGNETEEVNEGTTEPSEEPSGENAGVKEEESNATVDEGSKEDVEYEIDGVKFSKDQFKEMYDKWQNYKNWDALHHKKGKELNELRAQLEKEKGEIEEIKELAEEYRQARAVLEANPEAYSYLQELIQKGGGEASPRIKAVEDWIETQKEDLATERAMVKLQRELPDFNYDAIKDYMESIDWDNKEDVLKYQYNSWKGSKFDEELQKHLAEAAKKTPKATTPPIVGGSTKAPEEETVEYEDQEDLVNKALSFLKTGKI